MNEKIFNNIFLFLLIIFIIYNISPEQDSMLYILQKNLNYIIFQLKVLLNMVSETENFTNTFQGLKYYQNIAPSFKSTYEINYVKYFTYIYPNINKNEVFKLYNFLQSLVPINIDTFFMTPSDIFLNKFSDNEKEQIKKIILKKLNSQKFVFNEFNFESEPTYYNNINGKELESFIFNVNSNIGKIRIYMTANIRNDINQNKEVFIINEIKPLIDKHITQYEII